MVIYGVYCIDEEETTRYVGTMREIVQEFNCREDTFRRALCNNHKFKAKYRLVRLYEDKTIKRGKYKKHGR